VSTDESATMVMMKAGKCPTDALSLSNRVVVHSVDHQGHLRGAKHVMVGTAAGKFLFTLEANDGCVQGQLGFSLAQRKWAVLSLNQVRVLLSPSQQ
jgi:hypothetical protein